MKASLEDTWMNKKMKKDVKLSPSAIIAVGFLLLILTATLPRGTGSLRRC